jgi:hypothetical protein
LVSAKAECAEYHYRQVLVPMDVIAHKYPNYQGLCHYNKDLPSRGECLEIVFDCAQVLK